MLPVSIDQLIADCKLATNGLAVEKNISFNASIETNLTVNGDYTKLKRVIINLINNALDALDEHKVKNATIDIQAKKVDDHIIITLKDNGPGIPPKIIENLFEAFVTSGKSNGTGLGLAIVKQFIVAHYGSITVKNNDGAEFTIKLPSTN